MTKAPTFEDLEEAMIRGEPIPHVYLQACEAMGLALKGYVSGGKREPRFLLGPLGVHLVGPCIVPAICQNDEARALVQTWVKIGRHLADAMPTVRMVEAVLLAQRVPFERAARVADLGIGGTSA